MWPDPPYNTKIPDIPKSFTVFGVKFQVKDNFPHLSEYKEVPFNIEELKEDVRSSLQTYLSILTKIREKVNVEDELEKLNAIHSKINDRINCAKGYEAEQQIKQLVDEKNKINKEVYEELSILTNRKRFLGMNGKIK